MPSNSVSVEASQFEILKCGEPYNHPLPVSKEDPWTTLLKPLQAKDEARCKAWKEEVENLLIFAGLFSAVVTPFIVESYKTLQQDTGESTVILLSRFLDVAGSGSLTANSTIPAFVPVPSNVRINILWFLSLVLSLATVLIGIVSLQWLREHQRPQPDLSPQLAYSLFHMHAEAIDRWYLPQIFMMLPLLLQCGLVFFLVGVAEFLWQLNRSAAIPIIIAIGFTISFLAMTTIFPTMQAIALFLPRISWLTTRTPRVQCPYMSPQSWAFHRLFAPVVHIIMRILSARLDMERVFYADTAVAKKRHTSLIPLATQVIFRLREEDSWIDHGIGWLYQRDIDYISMFDSDDQSLEELASFRFLDVPPPMFDGLNALMNVVKRHSSKSEGEIIATENCIQLLSQFAKLSSAGLDSKFLYFQYLHQITALEFTKSDDLDFLQDHFLLRSGHGEESERVIELKQHRLEMALRLAEWTFATNQPVRVSEEAVNQMMEELGDGEIEYEVTQKQLLHICQSFFKTAREFHTVEGAIGQTSYTAPSTTVFLWNVATILARASSISMHEGQDTIFLFITSNLRAFLDSLDDVPLSSKDFLFYMAIIYTQSALLFQNTEISDDLRNLTETLFEYHARVGRRRDIEECLALNFDEEWRGYLGLVTLAAKHGIVCHPQESKPSYRTDDPLQHSVTPYTVRPRRLRRAPSTSSRIPRILSDSSANGVAPRIISPRGPRVQPPKVPYGCMRQSKLRRGDSGLQCSPTNIPLPTQCIVDYGAGKQSRSPHVILDFKPLQFHKRSGGVHEGERALNKSGGQKFQTLGRIDSKPPPDSAPSPSHSVLQTKWPLVSTKAISLLPSSRPTESAHTTSTISSTCLR